MTGFDNLNEYLKKIALDYPNVLVVPVAILDYNVELDSRGICGIDLVWENHEIAKKTKLKDKVLDFDDMDCIDEFYYDVLWNMALDNYERELKYIANIDDDDDNDYVALLKRDVNNNFGIEIELIK